MLFPPNNHRGYGYNCSLRLFGFRTRLNRALQLFGIRHRLLSKTGLRVLTAQIHSRFAAAGFP